MTVTAWKLFACCLACLMRGVGNIQGLRVALHQHKDVVMELS